MEMKWRNPYDEDENEYIALLTNIDCTGDPGMTMQAPAEEQDINVIMKRFGIKDGSRVPYWTDPNAIYGDFSEMPLDPVEAAEILRRGEVEFMTLPANIRKNFDSGAELYNWMQDPKNTKEAVTLGLLEQRQPDPASLDTIAAALNKMTPGQGPVVSSSTSSDKGTLVQTSNGEKP